MSTINGDDPIRLVAKERFDKMFERISTIKNIQDASDELKVLEMLGYEIISHIYLYHYI